MSLFDACDRVDVERLLIEMIRIPSPNPPGAELGMARFVEERMRGLGFRTRLDEVLPNRPNALGILEFSSDGPKLLFDVHIDTNPAGDESLWRHGPYDGVLEDERIYGRGAVDDKGSMAALLGAIEAIVDSGLRLKGSLIVVGAMGEESTSQEGSGLLGTKAYLEMGIRADMAVVGEPTSNRVAIAHKGAYRPHIRVIGSATHSSVPEAGINAIAKAARLISAIEEYASRLKERRHPILGSGTIAVTWVAGGLKPNTIPPYCDIIYDRRLIPDEDEALAKAELYRILDGLSKKDAEFKAEVLKAQYYRPAETPRESKVVKIACEAVSRVTGLGEPITGLQAGCDMSLLVNEAGIPSVVLGPGDLEQAHSIDESIKVKQLREAVKIYAELIRLALS